MSDSGVAGGLLRSSIIRYTVEAYDSHIIPVSKGRVRLTASSIAFADSAPYTTTRNAAEGLASNDGADSGGWNQRLIERKSRMTCVALHVHNSSNNQHAASCSN